MTLWAMGLAGVVGLVAIGVNLPTRLWMPAQKATLLYLAATKLQRLDGSHTMFAEASSLSSILPQLEALNFRLVAVVHETHGVEDFQPFFKGEIFLDKERRFYGPKERWMFYSGFLRPSVWMNIRRAMGKDIPGNLEGEGRILGGVFAISAGTEGILFEHRESEWGDHANITDLLEALS